MLGVPQTEPHAGLYAGVIAEPARHYNKGPERLGSFLRRNGVTYGSEDNGFVDGMWVSPIGVDMHGAENVAPGSLHLSPGALERRFWRWILTTC